MLLLACSFIDCSVCFLVAPGQLAQRWHPPPLHTVIWELPYKSPIKKIYHSLARLVEAFSQSSFQHLNDSSMCEIIIKLTSTATITFYPLHGRKSAYVFGMSAKELDPWPLACIILVFCVTLFLSSYCFMVKIKPMRKVRHLIEMLDFLVSCF